MDKNNPALVIVIVISLITLFMVINTNFSLTNEVVELRAMISDIKGESSGKQTDDDLMAALDEIRILIEGAVDRIGELSSESGMDDSSVEVSGIVDKMGNLISQIDEMAAMISNLADKSDALSLEKELSALLGQLEELGNELESGKILNTVEESLSSINDITVQIKELAEDVASKASAENVEAVKNNVNALYSQITELKSGLADIAKEKDIHSLNDRLSDISVALSNLATSDARIAQESYSLAIASDVIEEADAYYLNAINHEPSNEVYFNAYMNFLKSIDADYGYYYSLYMLLVDKLYTVDSSAVVKVNDFISDVGSVLGQIADDVSEENLQPVWNSLMADFTNLAVPDHFDYQSFSSNVSAIRGLYNLFATPSEAIENDKIHVDYISSMVEIYNDAYNVTQAGLKSSLDAIEALYPSICNVLSIGLSEFVSRDVAMDKEYASLFSIWQSELIDMQSQVDSRYEVLLMYEARKVLTDDITDMPVKERLKYLEDIQHIFTTLAAIGDRRDSELLVDKFSKIQTEAQKDAYSEYQYFAAKRLDVIDKAVSDAAKEDKLEALFQNGYFNINQVLLIPQLSTWYASLLTKDIREDSDRPYDELIKQYPINIFTIEDVL